MKSHERCFIRLLALLVVLIFTAGASGCGGNGNGEEDTGQDPDVTPDPVTDDVATDPAPDEGVQDPPVEDVAHDPPEEDAAVDPTEEDAAGDVTTDADAPVDTVEEESTGTLCEAAGGECTNVRWEMCPTGTEPIEPDPHQDCPGGSEGTQGWCCVDAPPSTCSDDSSGNCIVGTECTGCWGPMEGYECEEGRVCCIDICD